MKVKELIEMLSKVDPEAIATFSKRKAKFTYVANDVEVPSDGVKEDVGHNYIVIVTDATE